MSSDAPIGIFDSGLGGLTVARAIIDQLPPDPYGFGTWTFTLMWGEGVNDNTYAAGDDYFICGACSDDVGGLATVYSVSESDWNPSTEQYNKYKAFISTCSVTKYDEVRQYLQSLTECKNPKCETVKKYPVKNKT